MTPRISKYHFICLNLWGFFFTKKKIFYIGTCKVLKFLWYNIQSAEYQLFFILRIVLELKMVQPIVAPISSMMETNVQVSYINSSQITKQIWISYRVILNLNMHDLWEIIWEYYAFTYVWCYDINFWHYKQVCCS